MRLLRKHVELHRFQGDGGTAVEVIVSEAPELLTLAFAAGLHPDDLSEPSHQTLLQHAAAEGDLDRLELLLCYGADPEKQNKSGEVALGYACSWGQLAATRRLVEAGAKVNVVEEDPATGYRNTPLDCAHRFPEIVEYLRRVGAKHLEELEA